MSPKVAECGEIARQKLKTARECWEKGAFERAARESRNAVCAGCVAVGLSGFGDPWSTFEKACHLGSNRQHPLRCQDGL